MSPITPNDVPTRFDIYGLAHKGIRAALADALAGAGRLDWQDHEETGRMVATVHELALLCRTHLALEEQFIHAAMEARRPGSTRDTVADHRHHVADIDRLEELALGLAHLPSLRREPAAYALYRHLARFTADNLAHMAMEESANARVLWETHDDAELHAMHQAIVAAQSPEQKRVSLRWMLPGMAPAERAAILAGMRSQVPPAVFSETLAATLALLDARNAAKLQSALGIEYRPADYVGMTGMP